MYILSKYTGAKSYVQEVLYAGFAGAKTGVNKIYNLNLR